MFRVEINTMIYSYKFINSQGSKGIRQLMYIPNDDTQNKPFFVETLVNKTLT